MIEQDIEKRIVERLKALGIQTLAVEGLWQPTASGLLKGAEDCRSPSAIVVRTSPRRFDSYGLSGVEIEIRLLLTVRVDLDPQGAIMSQTVGSIQSVLDRWNMGESQRDLEELCTEGFTAGGIHLNGTIGPELDRETMAWSVEWTLSLRGTLEARS